MAEHWWEVGMAKSLTQAAEDRLLRNAAELAHDRDKNWIDLSLCLAERANLPDREGREQDFVARLGFSSKTYYRYLKMGRGLQLLPLNSRTRDRLATIGPTKFEMLCETITAANAPRLLRLAEEKTTVELAAELRGVGYAQKPWRVRFDIKREDQPKVEQALLACGAERDPRNAGLRGKEEALLKLIDRAFGEQKGGTSAAGPRRSR
jgi:hypothetical protein